MFCIPHTSFRIFMLRILDIQLKSLFGYLVDSYGLDARYHVFAKNNEQLDSLLHSIKKQKRNMLYRRVMIRKRSFSLNIKENDNT